MLQKSYLTSYGFQRVLILCYKYDFKNKMNRISKIFFDELFKLFGSKKLYTK